MAAVRCPLSFRMQIVELAVDDRADIVEVLTRSFFDYPVFTYSLRDTAPELYEHHLRLLCGFYADARLMRGWPVYGIREEDELAGVLLLSDPVFKPRPRELDAVLEEVRQEVGAKVMEFLDAFDAALVAFEPKVPTYFVGMVGVRPSSQGRGLGRALLEHIAEMSRTRPESAGVTLTTELGQNVAFYKHLGYRVLGSARVGEITTWLFFLEN